MEVSWSQLSPGEARGHVRSYTVMHRQLSSDSSRQEEQRVRVPAEESEVLISGLQADETYYIQAWASTAAGEGVRTQVMLIEPPSATGSTLAATTSATSATVAGASGGDGSDMVTIVSGSAALVFIVALAVVIVSVAALAVRVIKKRGRRDDAQEENSYYTDVYPPGT